MSRWLIALAAGVAAASEARAQPADPAAASTTPAPAARSSDAPASAAPPAAADAPASSGDEIGDQAISAQVGLATGGRVTPGGLRVAGHYLYQLSARDWFDGTASFTFGSGGAACFRDRADAVVCQHGLADGTGVEVTASVRRMLAPQGAFHPFVRIGIGLGAARFSRDDVSGFTIPLHGGGGVRVRVSPAIAIVVDGELILGVGGFNRGLGAEPQLGLAITGGAEFRLR